MSAINCSAGLCGVAKAGALRADISQCANGQHALVMQFMIQSDLNLN